MRIPAPRMRQQVIIHGKAKQTPDGPSWDAPRTVRAGVEFRIRAITDATGKTISTSAKVELDPENAVKLDDELTLSPGTPLARRAKVVSVGEVVKPRQATVFIAYVG